MVALEELVAQFYLRVQEVIKRLEDLKEVGRITGMICSKALVFMPVLLRVGWGWGGGGGGGGGGVGVGWGQAVVFCVIVAHERRLALT